MKGPNKLKFFFADKTNETTVVLEDWMPGKYLVRLLTYVSMCDALGNFPIILGKSLHILPEATAKIIVDALNERQVIYMHKQSVNTIAFGQKGTLIDNPAGTSSRAVSGTAHTSMHQVARNSLFAELDAFLGA